MRLAPLVFAVLPGCAESLAVGRASAAATDPRNVQTLRQEIRSKRYAAGLTPAQFEAETRLLNQAWWTSDKRAAEIREHGTEWVLSGKGENPPQWPVLWPERYLFTRAAMLLTGATETQVVQRVVEDDPHWFRWWKETVAEYPQLALGVDPAAIREPIKPEPPKPVSRYG